MLSEQLQAQCFGGEILEARPNVFMIGPGMAAWDGL
jgi:hypothetical protein